MTSNDQLKLPKTQDVSPLAHDPTYGERVYQGVFSTGINFFANLLLSGSFTYWVTHSHSRIKLFGREFNRPSEVQQTVANFIETKPFMKVFGDSARKETAKVMAGVFTLTLPGHVVMIPNVWISARIKSRFVEHFNRKHYGDEAMDDPSLQARHLAIRAEERPTLFGAVVGRLGTILATQFTAYTIGSQSNSIQWLGKRTNIKVAANFKGIDHATEFMGDRFGGIVSESMPGFTSATNKFMAERGNLGWSTKQVAERPGLANKPYGSAIDGRTSGVNEHLGKYIVSDVLYTLVTSVTINPAINFLKKFLPGMTYKPQVAKNLSMHDMQALPPVRQNPVVDGGLHLARDAVPSTAVSEAAYNERLVDRPAQVGVTV